MKEKVMVLIVTFNRKDFLTDLLTALSLQTRKPDRILIIDNHSSDGTAEHLIRHEILHQYTESSLCSSFWNNIEILYYRNSVNTGGAGGFHKALELAMTLDNDYLWLMDDDALPFENCLEKLLKKSSTEYGVCIPNRSTRNFVDKPILSFNWTDPHFLAAEKLFQDHYGTTDCIEVCDMAFEGPLIRADIAKKVGLSDESYFIFYDDSDYALRCLQHTKILFVAEAHLTKRILPNEYKTRFSWRDYYMYRNDFLFDKKYNPDKAMPYRRAFQQIIRGISAQLKVHDYTACRYILKAYWDALRNKHGKTIDPEKPL